MRAQTYLTALCIVALSLGAAAQGALSALPRYDDECVVFMHIPKAGGSTLRRDLVQAAKSAGKGDVFLMYGSIQKMPLRLTLERFRERVLRGELRDDYYIFSGHFGARVPEALRNMGIRRNCTTITLLREPMSRAVSGYYFGMHDKYKTDDDFRRCLRGPWAPKTPRAAWNPNPREMRDTCLIVDEQEVRRFGDEIDTDRHGRLWQTGAWGAINESDYLTARRNLARYDVVMILEDMAASYRMIDRSTGLRMPAPRHINKNGHPHRSIQAIPADIVELLRLRTRWSRLLYEDALEIHSRQYRRVAENQQIK